MFAFFYGIITFKRSWIIKNLANDDADKVEVSLIFAPQKK